MTNIHSRRKRGGKSQRGFTMIEALVALVVLAVGMLGMAGLYVATLRSGSGAIYRMQAINLASDIADRIRANRNANVAYAGAAANNNCAGNAPAVCTPDEMAANDLALWQQQLAQVLPAGAGVVAVNGLNAPYLYTITVSWSEPGQVAPLTYTLQMQI
jgi:type IV pilus assembly protein PilV